MFVGKITRMVCVGILLFVGRAVFPLSSVGTAESSTPELPRLFVDTTMPSITGNTYTVHTGGNLQEAINQAAAADPNLNHLIEIEAGATFSGSFVLKSRAPGTGWIILRSSAISSLPLEGVRVIPSYATYMPKITHDGTDYPLKTVMGAHHYRFVGIEITPTSGAYLGAVVNLGSGIETSLDQLVHHLVFDRCYVHGDPVLGSNKGIAMNGNYIAVIDSYISDLKGLYGVAADTNALWAFNSAGPIKIVNNHLEAAGQNVFFGGASPTITNLLVSDIEIRRNHFYKPVQWNPAHPLYAGTHWGVKNSLQFKHGLRVLVEGNVFENCWMDAQAGYMIGLGPKNETGRTPWAEVSDVTIQYNWFVNSASAVGISGGVGPRGSGSGDGPTQQSKRILIQHNLIEHMSWQYQNVTAGGDRKLFAFGGLGGADLTIDHNTGLMDLPGQAAIAFLTTIPYSPLWSNLTITNNILKSGVYEMGSEGAGNGTAALAANSTSYTFAKNALIGPWPTSGGVRTNIFAGADYWSMGFPAEVAAVRFINLAAGDYRLAFGSPYKNAGTDGKDLGVDVAALFAALGLTPPSLTPSPPTQLRVLPPR